MTDATETAGLSDTEYLRALRLRFRGPEVAKHNARLESIAALLDRAAEGIAEAARQFRFYEEQHLAKTPPDTAKAATNKEFANRLEALLRDMGRP